MKRPKICLVAPPYSGHLHPVIGLAKELEPIADVMIVSTPSAGKAVVGSGLDFRAILAEREEIIRGIATPGHAVKSDPVKLFRQLRANVSLQSEALAELAGVFQDWKPDLVIADFTLPVAGVAARREGARWWTSLPSPCVFETPDGPPSYFGGLLPAESVAEKLLHALLRKLTRMFKRLMFFLFRRSFREAGLMSVYREDGSERVYSDEAILAVGMPELEFSNNYPEHFHFIGPLKFTPPVGYPAPEFEDGKKHVLVTLGTHLTHRKDAVAGLIREMAGRFPGWVFHFSDGADEGREVVREESFHRYPFVSYADHLDRYDLVVHHGGSGVVWHCLSRGIPAVVMPMDFDQFDYAARLSEAGVARWVKDETELEAEISAAMGDPLLMERAKWFAGLARDRRAGEIARGLLERSGIYI